MQNTFRIDSCKNALDFQKNGRIEEWIHLFLNSTGNNSDFSKGLKAQKRFFSKILEINVNEISRNTGPELNNKYIVTKESFEKRVTDLKRLIINEFDLPPLIIKYENNIMEVNDGNHRLEALKRLGKSQCKAILWCSDNENYEKIVMIE